MVAIGAGAEEARHDPAPRFFAASAAIVALDLQLAGMKGGRSTGPCQPGRLRHVANRASRPSGAPIVASIARRSASVRGR